MSDEEYFAARTKLRQVLGRLRALDNDTSLPSRARQYLQYAIVDSENALKALRGEPTSAAG